MKWVVGGDANNSQGGARHANEVGLLAGTPTAPRFRMRKHANEVGCWRGRQQQPGDSKGVCEQSFVHL